MGNDEKWENRKFEDLLDLSEGIRRGPFGSMLKKELFVPESNYVVYEQYNAISDKYNTRYNIRQETYEDLQAFKLNTGDFIMSGAGTIGRISRVPKGIKKGVFNQALIRIKINPKWTESEFFLQWMRSDNIQKKLTGANPASAMVNLVPMSEVKSWNIIVPCKEEQQKIGQFFKDLDEMITTEQRKVAKIKALKAAYLAEMFPSEGELVPERRFTGFTGEWEERYLFDNIKSIIDFRGRTPKKLGLKWSEKGYLALSALNVKNGYIDFKADVHYGNQELYDKWMAGRELRKGQVLFTTEAPMGNVAQLPDSRGYILSQRTIAFVVTPEKITDEFLAVLLRTPGTFKKLSTMSSGGTAKGVSQKSLEQLKVIVPNNLEEQQKIGEFFKQLDDKITNTERKLEKLKSMKQAYLQEMFV